MTHRVLCQGWGCHVGQLHLVRPHRQGLDGVLVDVAHQVSHQVHEVCGLQCTSEALNSAERRSFFVALNLGPPPGKEWLAGSDPTI